jgi:hypothetical protein
VVDLAEAKLTHVVVDKRDVSRRLELMKRTSKSVTFTPTLSYRIDEECQGPSDVILLYLNIFKHAWTKGPCSTRMVSVKTLKV